MYIKRPNFSSNLKKVASLTSRKSNDTADRSLTTYETGEEAGDDNGRVRNRGESRNREDRGTSGRNRERRTREPRNKDESQSHGSFGRKHSNSLGSDYDGSSYERRGSNGFEPATRPRRNRNRRDRERSNHKKYDNNKIIDNGSIISKPKVVVPSGVSFRPGRLQSLTAKEEIILKQVWAQFLKYWGYDINISLDDLKFKQSFVASSISPGATSSLHQTGTRNSLNSTTSASTNNSNKKKLGGFFGSAPKIEEEASPAANSPRLLEIEQNSLSERFIPCDKPDESVVNVFVNHYKLSFQYHKNYLEQDYDYDESDTASMESFVTASTTITYPDDTPTISSKNYGKGTNKNLANSIPKTPIRTVPEVNSDIAKLSPGDWQKGLINILRHDLPDNFILKFIRARKWNVDNALEMLSTSMLWRQDFTANEWVMEGDAPSYLQGKNQGLVKNFTTEKSWIIGEDFEQSPIYWFLTKKHFGSDSPSNETQRYAVLCIEWCRLFTREVNESCDTYSIVFDLTGFTLKNADYTTIKFLAEAFEAHYPECLGKIYVHSAPWIFSTVWNIIKHWLDPVVASKIIFTKDFQDLSQYISPDYIPTELGGTDLSGPEYPIPETGDDVPPKKLDEKYQKLMVERDQLFMRLFSCTIKWCQATNPEISSKYLVEKIKINIELSNNYIQLDPYIRNPGPYDRNGSVKLRN